MSVANRGVGDHWNQAQEYGVGSGKGVPTQFVKKCTLTRSSRRQPCTCAINKTVPIESLRSAFEKPLHSVFRQFTEAIFAFFNETLPKEWETIADVVTDNFRVITHDDHRIIG